MTTAPGAAVELRGASRRFEAPMNGAAPVVAVDDVDLVVAAGSFVALTGPSGSGKSTLLHLVGALDRATSGDVLLFGRSLANLSRHELAAVRQHTVGFVFQSFNLLPGLTVEENVALPAVLAGQRRATRAPQVARLLDLVGLTDKARHRPAQLSGGEQQRVAVARALVLDPPLLLADEPTGNLDSASGDAIVSLFEACVDAGTTVLLVTHDQRLAARAGRVVRMRDGAIVSEARPAVRAKRPISQLVTVEPAP